MMLNLRREIGLTCLLMSLSRSLLEVTLILHGNTCHHCTVLIVALTCLEPFDLSTKEQNKQRVSFFFTLVLISDHWLFGRRRMYPEKVL